MQNECTVLSYANPEQNSQKNSLIPESHAEIMHTDVKQGLLASCVVFVLLLCLTGWYMSTYLLALRFDYTSSSEA
ncbi:hypothetical protein Y032_0266g706 [Ancylostoma ceylanicum]|uniref:Uncharacterized protein n=1 Tax=Ancylostoma ceylanicum TaxID=53326 RepID=A0A016SA53_9BILA|nr:hypothetical protein Y032_0266g706 [Ancylostoma ceylanicum]